MAENGNNFKAMFYTYILSIGIIFLFRCATIYYTETELFKDFFWYFFSDLCMAIFIGSCVYFFVTINFILGILTLLIALLLIIGNFESIFAINKAIYLDDFRFFNFTFIGASLSFISFPLLYIFCLTLIAVYLRFIYKKSKPGFKNSLLILGIGILALLLGTFFKGHKWQNTNPLFLTFFSKSFLFTKQKPLQKIHFIRTTENAEKLTPFPKNPPNILLIVLEGIPGAYITRVSNYFGTKNYKLMPQLSKIAKKSLVIPNFVTHSHQTIRGLYTMLTGDYSKLGGGIPKASEYFTLPLNKRIASIPLFLTKLNYKTLYIQSADLGFMLKKSFMKAISFQQIYGKEYFKKNYVEFSWGPDDRAFFEKVFPKIEKTKPPWFITLLTVGTHHPYAVPKNYVKRFNGNRKKAAIFYLDEALGVFFNSLNKKGITKNTLIIITSDESHGVANQPYGDNWGLCLVYGNGIKPVINQEVYGLIDIPRSIADYIEAKNNIFPGRSFFRKYQKPREILFSSEGYLFYSKEKGKIYSLDEDGKLSFLQTKKQQMFASTYTEKKIRNKKIKNEIITKVRLINNSLANENREIKYSFIKKQKVLLEKKDKWIFGGQYIDIEGDTKVTVSWQLRTSSFAHFSLIWDSEEDIENLPDFEIPSLKPGEEFRIKFSFLLKKEAKSFCINLLGAKFNKGICELEVNNFVIHTRKRTKKDQNFKIHQFTLFKNAKVINNKVILKDDLVYMFFNYKLGTRVLFDGSNFSSCMFLLQHFSSPEKWGTWSNGKFPTLEFFLEKLVAKRYKAQLVAKCFLNEKFTKQKIIIYVNGHKEKTLFIEKKVFSLFFFIPKKHLFENAINRITFEINKPISPYELKIGKDRRKLGIGLISFVLDE